MDSSTRYRLSRIAAHLLALREESVAPATASGLVASGTSLSSQAHVHADNALTSVFRDASPSDAGAIVDFVRVCEAQGHGEDALRLLAQATSQRHVGRSALPLIATEAAVLMVVLALYSLFVLPQLKATFDAHGVALPEFTQDVFVVMSFLLPVIGVLALAAVVGIVWRFSPLLLGPLVRPLDRIAMKLPAIGTSLRRQNTVRVAGWLGFAPADENAQRAAVDAARLWSSGLTARLCTSALARDPSGERLALRLAETNGFDRDFTAAATMSDRAQAQKALRALWRLRSEQRDDMPPPWIGLLHFGLGILVAMLVIAMYLPIFKIGTLT